MLLRAPCKEMALSEEIKELRSLAPISAGAATAPEQNKERSPATDDE